MKTPEQLAEEFAKKFYGDGEHIDFPDSQTFYVAGYQAAKDQLEPFNAGADVYIIDANNPLPKPMPLSIAEQHQFADASKVIPKWNSTDAIGDAINRSAIQHVVGQLKNPLKPEWISVKERLPREDESVLIYQPKAGCWVSSHDKHGWGMWENGLTCEPTYWMPLPEPPKED